MFLGQETSCFSFVFWFLQSLNWLQTEVLYLWHFDCLDIHFCLSDEWFSQLVALMTPPEETFIDKKPFISLLASYLRLLTPEVKFCILVKCKTGFQDTCSSWASETLQNNTKFTHKKILKTAIKHFPDWVLCFVDLKKRIFWGCGIFYILEQKEKVFPLCAACF